jgi:hypothetical protein
MTPIYNKNYNTFVRIGGGYADPLTGEFIEDVTRPPDREGGGLEDLTILNKVPGNSYIILHDHTKKEYIVIDNRAARISRMNKRVFSWAESIKPVTDKNSGCQMLMIGLTYKPGQEWKANDIRDYIIKLKRRVGIKNIIGMARVGELQERGAVHYHIVIVVKKGVWIPKPDKSGLWWHGSSKVEVARSPFYLVSYTKKKYQKEGIFPKGIRMYEVWINPEYITLLERWHFRLSTLPAWLKAEIIKDTDKLGEKWNRLTGGGWSFAGQEFRSPYRFVGIIFT